MTERIAVLASGRGSNLRALHAYLARAGRPAGGAEIVLVASDKHEAGALEFARERGIDTTVLPMDASHAGALARALDAHAIDYLVLAGYLRLVPPAVVGAYRGRVINVHPALLPAFGGKGMYGERVHRAVLASGARVSGVTVHFVDEAYDRGAIIAQWPVPVLAGDTPASLAARVLRVEHLLLPRAVEAVAAGRVRLSDTGSAVGPLGAADAAFALGDYDDAHLAHDISAALGG